MSSILRAPAQSAVVTYLRGAGRYADRNQSAQPLCWNHLRRALDILPVAGDEVAIVPRAHYYQRFTSTRDREVRY